MCKFFLLLLPQIDNSSGTKTKPRESYPGILFWIIKLVTLKLGFFFKSFFFPVGFLYIQKATETSNLMLFLDQNLDL